MGLIENFKQAIANVFTSASPQEGEAWWVEVTTETPRCTYFFGPFDSSEEAQNSQYGYLEDLRNEGANHIQAEVKKCQPQELTIFSETDL